MAGTRVQGTSSFYASAITPTVTLSGVGAGNTLKVAVHQSGDFETISISDNHSQIWTKVGDFSNSDLNNGHGSAYEITSSVAGNTTVTFTFGNTRSSWITFEEFSGLTKSDVATAASGSNAVGNTNQPVDLTTTTTTDMLWTACVSQLAGNNRPFVGIPSGWQTGSVDISNLGSLNVYMWTAYLPSKNAGAQHVVWSTSQNTLKAALLSANIEGGGGGGGGTIVAAIPIAIGSTFATMTGNVSSVVI